ncbi:Ig-like domain-containing protein, partial [Flavobacterium terrisoli]|uniref:Ig-like domain-containing protein n=1 Tax=Flavobacterium terrisoli TaxID=3242195 RepID=UPI003FD7982D
MKIFTRIKNILFVALILFSFQGFSQNLLNNGNFETGTVIGFFSNGAGYSQINPPYSGTTIPGNWSLTTNPLPMNTASFVASGDHTSGTGYMMVIDGNTTGGQQNFWEAGNGGGGVCGLTTGVTYTFSYWIRSIYGPVAGSPTPANIGVQILNASAVTLVSGSAIAPPTASGWQQVVYTFVANGPCANIKLFNNNTSAVGNDFAVDDFSVTAPTIPLTMSNSVSNVSCPGANDGSIVIFGVNGVQPYVSYSITGPVSQTNTTGVFTGLPAGTYTLSVTDSDSPASTATTPNVVITQPGGITAGAFPSTICAGATSQLSTSGSANPYNWTASPADPSLTTPNIANPVVSPTQTTTYTVTSTVTSNRDLIFNGDFSQGNNGFTTDYQYLTVTVPAGAQRTYGIVTNSNAWFAGFSSCTANGGSGNMFVADGSNQNAGNDSVWCQTVAVVPGQNYTFSYWVQTVATPNPANIEVMINGASVGIALAPATACGWVQRSYVWNSGASTSAQICLFDRVITSGGNDFSLDDISFTGPVTCNLSQSVTVNVNPSASPVIACGTSTASSVSFNWGAVTGATGYTISYTINSGTAISGGNTAATTYAVNGLNANDSVTITVTPTGASCLTASSQTCIAAVACVVPTVSVTQQPTCTVPTGTIVFTSPLNTGPLPIPTDLFISEVSDESTGALSYIEIFNGTGAPKNLANYKLKVYNNGNATPSGFCDFPLAGTLANNDVYVVGIGSATNVGGVIPDLVVSACPGYNTNDNVRLATSADVEFDLWGRTDGIDFTPANQSGYTYRRLASAPHPTMTWNPADWTALDPQDYTNFGTYSYQAANYEYSVNGTTYQSSPTFTGLAPGNYNVTVRDLVSGCISTPILLVVNPVPNATAPTVVSPVTYCQNATVSPLTATPSAGGTLNWYGTNATGGTASATAPTPSTASLGTTTYYVSQTVGGCESPRAAIVVNVVVATGVLTPDCGIPTLGFPLPAIHFDWNNIAGSGITMMAYTYTLYGQAPVSGVVNTGANGTHLDVYNPLDLPGTITITPANGSGCVAPITFSCNCPSPAISDPANQVFCGNSPISQFNFTTADAYDTVNWTNSNPAIGLAASGTSSGLFLPAFTSANVATQQVATISVTLIKYGCPGPTVDFTITINPQPTLVITNPATVCGPASINLTLPAVTAGSTGGGTLSYWTNAAGTTPLATPTAVTTSGTYYIKSTVGACSDIEPVTVTINPSPVLVITNPAAACSPATVNLTLPAVTAGSTGGGTLSYWTNAAATTALANPNAVTTSGTYYIQSTLGTCSDIEPVTVSINPSPVLNITNPAAVCSPATINLTLPAITAGSTGGGTLSYWTNAAGTTPLATPSAVTTSGTYYIRSTLGSCSDIEPVTVTINPAPVLNINNPAAVCGPASVNLTLAAVTAGSTGGGTLSYWTNAAATTALANPNAVTTSGTYYIQSTLGTCSDIEPVTVTINPSPVLVITNPAPVCSPSTVNLTLPAVTAGSTGGGTLSYWTNAAGTTPLASPNAVATSGTYYIRSTVGPCSDIEPVTVVVNPQVAPTFNITPSVVCEGAIITPLPTTSNNGISGTWSPALNNTATTTYTFTPTSSVAVPCPTPFTFQIQVVPQINPTVSVVESCNSNSVTVTNPVGANYEYSLDGGTFQSNPIFYNVTAGNHNIVANQTVANCLSNATAFNIVGVTNDVFVTNPQPLQYCDPSNDGFVTFDLSQVINSVTGGAPYTVTFHETITDANQDGTSIPDIVNYDNINPWLQVIYIRVESTVTSCFEIVPLQLIVNPTPEATEPDDYILCDNTGQTGFESFDLTTTIPQILGSINPTDVNVTFHTTLTDAQDDTNAIGGVTNYINQTQWNQTLYVRVEFITTGCYDVVELDLIVNPLPNATQPNYPQYSLCDYNAPIGYEVFDLASQVDPILLTQQGMTVTFYPSLTDAQNDSNAINISHPDLQYPNQIIYVQTLGIRITNDDTGCYSISTIDIRVEPLPTLIPPLEPYTLCDDNQDGFSCGFDLTTLLPDLLNGITTYDLTIHETLTDAQLGSTPMNITVPYCNIIPFVQTLYVRAVDVNTGCWSVLPIELNVNPSPIAPFNLDDIVVCDDDNNPQNAITGIDLTIQTPVVLALQPAGGSYTVTYYTSQAAAELGLAPIIPATNYIGSNGETIWVRVEDDVTGCYNIGSFQLIINIPLLLTVPAPLSICDDDGVDDQYHTFDLTVRDVMITQGLPGYTVTYYPNLTLAQAGGPTTITDFTNYINEIAPVQTLGVVVTSAAGCQSITTLDIRVLPIPTPNPDPAPLAPQCDDNNPGDMMEV